MTKIIMYSLILSQNFSERHKKGIFFNNLVQIGMDFYNFGKKIHLKSPKNCIFSLQKGFEPQYFTLRTMEKYGNLSIKNVLKISPKLRLSILITFVLIKKECSRNSQ